MCTATPGYDGQVTSTDPSAAPGPAADQPPAAAEPSPTPGERRLAHPPSDRYRAAEERAAAAAQAPDPAASVARGVAVALVVAIVGVVAIVVLGGVLAITGGLLVVAALLGWAVGEALRIGAGPHLAGGRRIVVAVLIALGAVLVGQLGLWQYARIEGGVLPPLDYLAEVFGPLVPGQLIVAAIGARIGAR